MAQLQKEVDEARVTLDSKSELREDFDKQLDKLSDRRKKERDDRDKLFKSKDELKDAYYAAMIDWSKQQALIKDIEWMNGIRAGLLERKAKRDKIEAEKAEKAERRRKEAEDREQARLDRIAKDEERKAQAAEDAVAAEAAADQKRIDDLHALNKRIADDSTASNPLADQIEQCDGLLKYCDKHTSKNTAEEAKGGDATQAPAKSSGLETQLKAGKVLAAPSKVEKEAQSMWAGLAGGKKKGKGRRQHA